jgi:hypothetical protein
MFKRFEIRANEDEYLLIDLFDENEVEARFKTESFACFCKDRLNSIDWLRKK